MASIYDAMLRDADEAIDERYQKKQRGTAGADALLELLQKLAEGFENGDDAPSAPQEEE